MKKWYLMATALSLVLAGSPTAKAISISYANAPGADISFNGSGDFSFTTGTSGYDFFINDGSAFNDMGTIGGTFTIGPVTTSGAMQTAAITGTGGISIADGSGNYLTAVLNWVNAVQIGTSITLNYTGNPNLTGVSYTGSNADLLALAASLEDSDTLSLTFNPSVTLTEASDTSLQTSFSGTITGAGVSSVPDDCQTAMLLGAALCAIGLYRNKFLWGC